MENYLQSQIYVTCFLGEYRVKVDEFLLKQEYVHTRQPSQFQLARNTQDIKLFQLH